MSLEWESLVRERTAKNNPSRLHQNSVAWDTDISPKWDRISPARDPRLILQIWLIIHWKMLPSYFLDLSEMG